MRNTRQACLSILIVFLALVFVNTGVLADPPCAPCTHDKADLAATGGFSHGSAMEGSAQSTTLEGGTQSTTLQGGTQSTTLQGGTQSTTLQGGTQSTTLQGGTQSTMLQGGTGATMLQGGTGSTMIQAQVKKDAGPLNVLILLDASQTMGQGMDNVLPSKQEQKMAVAKRVLKTTLQAIPVDVNVGLRVFGQSFNNAGSDCRQTALLVPIGKNNHQAIIDEIEPLTPKGMTPLAYTLMQAQRDFAGLPGERHIVLISDGFETCGGDPCSYIKRLSAMGYAMKVDIIGMGLKHDKIARDHLNCITQASGGHYYDADTAGELADHLKQSMLDAAGQGEVSGVVISKTHR